MWMNARLPQHGMPGSGIGATWAETIRSRPIAAAAITITIGGAATILGAWFFQYGLGLNPCPLCLEQRYPYYFAIPLAVLVLLGASAGASRKVLLAALFIIAAGMLWDAGLAGYHVGVEWRWWPGPRDCSGPIDSLGSANDLLSQLDSIKVVRCDEAAWRFLGLSLAGYNVLIALTLAAIAIWGVVMGRRSAEIAD
jgi:disulfide bond formation protein DsbB